MPSNSYFFQVVDHEQMIVTAWSSLQKVVLSYSDIDSVCNLETADVDETFSETCPLSAGILSQQLNVHDEIVSKS